MYIGWRQPYLHYREDGGLWTSLPGVILSRVSAHTPEGLAVYNLLPQRLRGYAEGLMV